MWIRLCVCVDELRSLRSWFFSECCLNFYLRSLHFNYGILTHLSLHIFRPYKTNKSRLFVSHALNVIFVIVFSVKIIFQSILDRQRHGCIVSTFILTVKQKKKRLNIEAGKERIYKKKRKNCPLLDEVRFMCAAINCVSTMAPVVALAQNEYCDGEMRIEHKRQQQSALKKEVKQHQSKK